MENPVRLNHTLLQGLCKRRKWCFSVSGQASIWTPETNSRCFRHQPANRLTKNVRA
jgi:hypothetical protein